MFSGSYSTQFISLIGVSITDISIEQTVVGYTNTVSFDQATGTFTGTIYTSNSSQPQEVTITYTRTDTPDPFWVSQKTIVAGLIGQRVTNIQASGFTPTGSDVFTVTFDQQHGTFKVYIKTFTQPTADIDITITYDLVLQDGTYIANTIKIYRDDAENFNWKNPTLGSATQVVGASLSFNHYNRYSKITINNVSDVSDSVFYVTDYDGNILLAVKGIDQFYLNVLLSRDYNVYDSSGNVVGNI